MLISISLQAILEFEAIADLFSKAKPLVESRFNAELQAAGNKRTGRCLIPSARVTCYGERNG